MKRSGPIARKTPLSRSTPVRRTAKPKAFPRPAPADRRMPRKHDEEYLYFIRSQTCCAADTGTPCRGAVQPHHYPEGKGFRDDAATVPLCFGHHMLEWHAKPARVGNLSRTESVTLFRVTQALMHIRWRDAA